MRRSRKPLCVVRRTEGSNPSPSAHRAKSVLSAARLPVADGSSRVPTCPHLSLLFTRGFVGGRGRTGTGTPGEHRCRRVEGGRLSRGGFQWTAHRTRVLRMGAVTLPADSMAPEAGPVHSKGPSMAPMPRRNPTRTCGRMHPVWDARPTSSRFLNAERRRRRGWDPVRVMGEDRRGRNGLPKPIQRGVSVFASPGQSQGFQAGWHAVGTVIARLVGVVGCRRSRGATSDSRHS
jgi:hypothetical protein